MGHTTADGAYPCADQATPSPKEVLHDPAVMETMRRSYFRAPTYNSHTGILGTTMSRIVFANPVAARFAMSR